VTIDTNPLIGNYETLDLKNVARRQNVRSGETKDKDSNGMGLVDNKVAFISGVARGQGRSPRKVPISSGSTSAPTMMRWNTHLPRKTISTRRPN
jgi:hypothetical protein